LAGGEAVSRFQSFMRKLGIFARSTPLYPVQLSSRAPFYGTPELDVRRILARNQCRVADVHVRRLILARETVRAAERVHQKESPGRGSAGLFNES
jgi:hypothetical protein